MNATLPNDMESRDDLERRLQSLPLVLPRESGFLDGVMERIGADNVQPDNIRSVQINRWIMRSFIGLAAGILIGLFVWWILVASVRPAFAIDEVEKRVFSLDSLHIKGMIYTNEKDPGRMIEVFAQQPDHCRVNGRFSTGPQGNAITDLIITPDKVVTVDPTARTATIVPENSQDAGMQVAQILQGMGQMMFGNAPGFKLVRREKLGDVVTDVYENRDDPHFRAVVWLNPSTQLPVQTETYWIDGAKPERLVSRFDTIEANPTISPDVFDTIFGAGWMMNYPNTHIDPDTLSLANNSCRFGSLCMSMRYLVDLGNGDLLICWCLFDVNHADVDMKLPKGMKKLTFSAMGGPTYTEQPLRADVSSRGFHWRWSLLHPKKTPGSSMVMLSMAAQTNTNDTCEIQNVAVTYKPAELAHRVEELQKQTLPADDSPMTLDQIEAAGQGERTAK